QPDALVVDDYYKQGKAINQDLRRDRVAASMKLQAEMRFDPAEGKLAGTLTSHGRPMPGKVLINLVHSTQPQKDLKLSAQIDEQGQFFIPLPMLDMARWQVVIEGEQRDWRLHAVWAWPQQKSIAFQADATAV
ncbi:MAG TPA: FixH family protein, partial [Noviherbaspirillum sp.]